MGAILVLSVAVVLGACSADGSDEPVPGEGAVPSVTGFLPGTTITWDAAAGPSTEDLAELRAEFEGYEAALLVPSGRTWDEGATVEARVDRFMPDAGQVVAGTVVRSQGGTDVVMSVQRDDAERLVCSERPDGRFEEIEVRGISGCAAVNGGPVAHVIWNEGGFRWVAESATYDAVSLAEQLGEWRLLGAGDF